MTIDQFIYGPFLDEELFFYDDTRTVIELDAVQIFDMDQGFVGFDDLERIHDQGRDGSYDRVMFSGVTEGFALGIDPKSLHTTVLMQTVYNAVIRHSGVFLKHIG